MAEQQTIILKMKYSGHVKTLSFAADVSYEDILDLAIQRFDIPGEFVDFIQILDEDQEVFSKDLFEYFVLLFPQSEKIFELRVDYKKLMRKSKADKAPLRSRDNNKRKRYYEVPVYRTYCFIGRLPGSDTSPPSDSEPQDALDEPKAKKPKTTVRPPTEQGTVKRKASSRCIRL